MAEFDCKKCLHEKVCALWAEHECQDASCFCQDGCDYFTPTLTPPNEPLTLEKLREMDGEPVWVEFEDGSGGLWGIVHITIFEQIVFPNGLHCTLGERYYGKSYKAYRRPPEGEEGDADRG